MDQTMLRLVTRVVNGEWRGNRFNHIVRPNLACFTILAVLLAACSTTATAESGSPALSSGQIAAVPPASWAREGLLLRHLPHLPPPPMIHGAQEKRAPTYPPFSYSSLPINLDRDGTFVVLVGPVAPSFNYPQSPSSLAFDFPPNPTFQSSVVGQRAVTLKKGRFLRVRINISHLTRPYHHFTIWVY